MTLSVIGYPLFIKIYVSNKFNENGREEKTFLSRGCQGKAFKA